MKPAILIHWLAEFASRLHKGVMETGFPRVTLWGCGAILAFSLAGVCGCHRSPRDSAALLVVADETLKTPRTETNERSPPAEAPASPAVEPDEPRASARDTETVQGRADAPSPDSDRRDQTAVIPQVRRPDEVGQQTVKAPDPAPQGPGAGVSEEPPQGDEKTPSETPPGPRSPEGGAKSAAEEAGSAAPQQGQNPPPPSAEAEESPADAGGGQGSPGTPAPGSMRQDAEGASTAALPPPPGEQAAGTQAEKPPVIPEVIPPVRRRSAIDPGEIPSLPPAPPQTTPSRPEGVVRVPAESPRPEAEVRGSWRQVDPNVGPDFLPGGYVTSLLRFRLDGLLEVRRAFGKDGVIQQTWRIGYEWSKDKSTLTLGRNPRLRPPPESLRGFRIGEVGAAVQPATEALPVALPCVRLKDGSIRLGEKVYRPVVEASQKTAPGDGGGKESRKPETAR